MNTLKELNKFADKLNSIPEPVKFFPLKKHYDIFKNKYGFEVYNNYEEITMASCLTLEQAIKVLNILNNVKGK